MNQYLSANEIKQQVSFTDLLARLGHQPSKRSGKEFIYLSMLRDSDTKPSLCVNDELGTWFDHGMGKGGTIIDFGLLYWKTINVKEVMDRINGIFSLDSLNFIPARNTERSLRPRMATKLPHYKIEEVKELGNNDAITSYLKTREVWNVASGKLKEVYYYVEDEKKKRKQFFAAGWQNENGGWEVRNKYFQGCLGRKGLTYIQGNPGKLVVFEGYLDYLSWLIEHKAATPTILVLNSVSFLQAAIKRAASYPDVEIFFDHDNAGYSATAEFLKAVPHARDSAAKYSGYNDYNEKLMAEVRELCSYQQPSYHPHISVSKGRLGR